MKLSDALKEAKICMKAGRPALFEGSPGIGKTEGFMQLADDTQHDFMSIRLLYCDPTDFNFPVVIDGQLKRLQPADLPQPGCRPTIILWDEIAQAPQMVQAAAMQIILERKLGAYSLPANVVQFAACNKATDKSGALPMLKALDNRFIHMSIEPDVSDWLKWSLNNNISIEVISFIKFRENLLFDFDAKRKEKAFPTPRSWKFVSDLMQADNGNISYNMVKGTVGEAAAAEFIGFLKIFKTLPNPDLIIMNPDAADVPTDPSTQYALSLALARKASQNTIQNIMAYMWKLPEELQVLTVKEGSRLNPEIMQTRTMIEWMSKNANVII